MIIAGSIIVIATIVLLILKYDAKVVLLGAGFLMGIIGGVPMDIFKAFEKSMTSAGLITSICSCMGFALVMKYTECDKHLVNLLASVIKRVPFFLIPGVVIATYLINVALPSAAGTAAAAGAVFIPLMMSADIHPAMAAAALKAGTYGSMLNPGLAHNAFVAKLAQATPMDVIHFHYLANIASLITACVTLSLVAYFTKEYKGHKAEGLEIDSNFKVNFVYALMPIVPIAILLLGATKVIPAFKVSVAAAMIIGAFLAIIVTRKSPREISNNFFNGMGDGYAKIMSIIIASGVFVAGMDSMGLVKAFTVEMMQNPAIMKVAAAVGPFLLGLITGSGDAATMAFNEAISSHAMDFGMTTIQMGSMATLGGTLGRTISPIAGATIIVAGIAGVNPLEVTKRNGIPIICALAVGSLILALGY
ncbi:MAG: C4-dicarboxylate transporter DcuC [Veillonella sp.]|uniref:C4-dicarboxylate transporter DcuC n=1 Tax=Veillonella sp. TaxID=1926307 RepID=UPI0025E49F9B|nr:C4-dicarboxylate transporter DcuC [Veillonella sp.]MBS4913238.1 C4-dicarboxylate transporter DcuC [Veillonella sp.]